MQDNIVSKIRKHASKNPTSPAFIYQNKLITYKQLDLFICSAAKILHEKGIVPGDTVVLVMNQSPVYCIVMFALAALGAVSVPLNPTTSKDARDSIRKKYDVKAVVTDFADAGMEGVPLLRMDTLAINSNNADLNFIQFKPTPDTTFCIAMSSGTTGEPKGFVYTHRFLLDMIDGAELELSNDSRLIPLALHIAFGFVLGIGVLVKGGTLAIPAVWNVPTLGEFINLYAVSHMALPPSVAMNFINFVPDGGAPFPSLKLLRIGGSGSSTKLIKALLAKFPKVFQVAYGLTELGAVSAAKAKVLAAQPMSSGKVFPRYKLEVVDELDNILPHGTIGEIRVKLDGMPDGYYRDEKNSDRKFRNGWYYTGDVGRISEDGLLFIDGRIDDIINLDGYKVSPGYVEEILTRHPQVKDAVVFGTKAKNGKKILAAAVILSEGEVGKDITDYSKANLGKATPKKFIAMQDFPRNVSGKVLRPKLISAALKMDGAVK